jgi:hypothetical protein
MTDNSKRTGAAIEAHYRFLVWLVPTLDKFPRSQKFTVGDRIQALALDVLEALIAATYTRDRAQYLRRGNHPPADQAAGLVKHARRVLVAAPVEQSEFGGEPK